MAHPTILFNNGTGSDTLASGAGPGTALTGTSASYSTTTVTLDGSPDLSGVATDSSHVLYLATSTGRRFFKITGTDNTAKTVTVHTAPTGTASGLSWAIGGKRKTIEDTNSRLLFSTDIMPGWTVNLEDDQPAVTSAVACSVAGDTTSGYITLQGTGGTRLLTSATNNTSMLSGGLSYWVVQNLKFTSTAATKTSSYGVNLNADGVLSPVIFKSCIFGDATNKLQSGIFRYTATASRHAYFLNCEAANCIGNGLESAGGSSGGISCVNCYIHDNGGRGVQIKFSSQNGTCAFLHCVISNNSSVGIESNNDVSNSSRLLISNCTIHNNSSDGIKINAAVNFAAALIFNNMITKNGGYGINYSASAADLQALSDHNNYGNASDSTANTSGAVNGFTQGANSTTIAAGYTNAAGGDYSIPATLKALGYPPSSSPIGINSATYSYVDPGAAQRQEPVVAGVFRHPGMSGGMNG